jgi:hypothetical protein
VEQVDSTRPPREEEEEVDQRREADRSQREQIRSSRSRSFRPIVRGLINRSRIFLSRNRGQGGYPAPQTAPAAAPPAPPPAPPQIQPVIIHLQAPFQPPPPPAQQQRYWQPRPAYHPYQQQQQFRQPFQPRWQHSQRGFGRGHWQPPRIASGTWQPAQYYPQQQGHFEQQAAIRVLTGRLLRYNAEAGAIDFTVAAGGPERMQNIDTLKGVIARQTRKMLNLLADIEKQNVNYVNFFSNLPDGQKAAERAIYEDFALGDAGYLTIMDESREIIEVLFDNERTLYEMAPTANGGNGNPFRGNSNVKLPEIKLPEFSGVLNSWTSFFEEFRAAVHDQDIPNKRKFQYLKSSLKGDALEMIEPYPLEGDNYPIVLALLEKRFGDKNNIKSNLHSELRRLPRSAQYTPEIKKTVRKIEAIIKQLENLEEEVEHPQLILEIESKLPKRILADIFRKKTTDAEWTLKKMMDHLNDYLKLEEDVFLASKNFETENGPKGHQPQSNEKFRNNFQRNNEQQNRNYTKNNWKPRGTAMYSYTEKNKQTETKKHECKFCNGMHWEAKCDKFPTNDQKVKRVQALKICFKCLGNNHNSKECQKVTTCFSCKRTGHNAAFCQFKEPKRGNFERSKNPNFAPLGKKENKQICMAVSQENEWQNESVLLNNLTGKVKKKEHKSEQTLLQVGTTRLRNRSTRAEEETNVFLDSGCEITLILNDLAKKLGLESVGRKKFRGCWLFNKSVTINSPLFEVDIICKDKSIIKVIARGVDDMVNALKIMNPNTNYQAPISAQDILVVQPQMIIGADYYGDVFDVPRLSSGFWAIPSKIGNIVYGRGNIHKDPQKTHLCQMTENIDKWWELEQFGISEEPTSTDDKFAIEHFNNTVERQTDGRYIVQWPIREAINISDNFWIAFKRLQSVWAKMAAKPEI